MHNLFIKSPGITVKHLNSLYLGALWIAAKSDDNKLPAGCKKLRNIVDYYYHCYEKFYGDGKREGSIESQSDEVICNIDANSILGTHILVNVACIV